MKQKMPMRINIKHTALDPHHDGLCEFGCKNQEFYCRTNGATRWTKMKKIHITPKRIELFYKLLSLDKSDDRFTIYGNKVN